MKPFQVTLFTKADCTLCDKAKLILERVGLFYPLVVTEFDVTTDPNTFTRYGEKIPVLHIEGEEAFVSKISEHWLLKYLREKFIESTERGKE